MKQLAAFFATVILAASPAQAEEDVQDGFSLMEEGARIILRQLIEEMEPTLEDLQGLAEGMAGEWAPLMQELRGLISDMALYDLPEVLPNGDIIIRRKAPQMPELPEPGEEIEL